MDVDKNGVVTFNEFRKAMESSAMVAYMENVGLTIRDVEHFFIIVAGGLDKEINVENFVDGCMSMKGMATSLESHKEYWLLSRAYQRLASLDDLCRSQLLELTA